MWDLSQKTCGNLSFDISNIYFYNIKRHIFFNFSVLSFLFQSSVALVNIWLPMHFLIRKLEKLNPQMLLQTIAWQKVTRIPLSDIQNLSFMDLFFQHRKHYSKQGIWISIFIQLLWILGSFFASILWLKFWYFSYTLAPHLP